MEAWVWFVSGLALLFWELFIPMGFYLMILGAAAVVVGIVVLLGLDLSLNIQLGIFSVVAVVIWYFLAERLQKLWRTGEKEYRGFVGQMAVAKESIVPGAKGSGEMWGSPWRLENVGTGIIQKDNECEVVSSDGITLQVKVKG